MAKPSATKKVVAADPATAASSSSSTTRKRTNAKPTTVSSDDEAEDQVALRARGRAAAAVADQSQGPPLARHGSAFRWSHVGVVFLVYSILAIATLWSHYNLPTPRPVDSGTLSAPAHFSEVRALEHISVLSDTIGYRIVGTEEHVRAEKWLESIVKQYEGWHTTVTANNDDDEANANSTRTSTLGDTEVEVWTQIDDGAHRFDFMSSVVWKKYYSMSNVIVRISDGTEQSKNDAVLLNAHLDSTLPSPGAADDGAGVAILLEMLRILTTPPRPRLRHAVILLFNNGEESLQDASHLYATAHETRHSVRGVVNLEACGTSGPELLFQATSVPFVEAYAKVPHPFGTVLANDVFATGLILSDTDFRQFVQYGNQSGLDIAIVGSSYKYHTRSDVTANLQPGMMQHFGENVLAIIDHLATSPKSKLVGNRAFPKRSPPIYFSIAGRWFFLIPAEKFRTVVMGVCAMSNYFLTTLGRADKHFGALKYALGALLFTTLSVIVGLASSNVVALIMVHVIGKPMSWYAREWYPVLLFGPPALAGILSTQYLYASLTRPDRRAFLERSSLDGILLFFVLALIGLSSAGIGTSYMPALGAVAMTLTIAFNDMYLVGFQRIESKRVAAHDRVHGLAYLLCAILPATIGSEGVVSFLDLFVPLTGRTGDISPADHIVGSIVGVLTFLCLPFALPMAFRMGMPRLRRAIALTLGVSALAIAIFASPAMKPFDAAHPKRVFVHAVQNITSETFWLNIGGADPDVKGLEAIVADLHAEVGIAEEPFRLMPMDEYNPDFAILYPVSNFITPYKMRVPMPQPSSPWTEPGGDDFVPLLSDEHIDWEAGTRRLTLTLRRPNLIWSVMAFDAEILEWDLPIPPLQGFQRHHLKEVARHGIDEWSVHMLLKLPQEAVAAAKASGAHGSTNIATANANPIRLHIDGEPARDPTKLWIDYSALIGEAMWPQAERLAPQRRRRYPSIDVLEELDLIMHRKHPEADTMLLSVVAAVAQV